MGPAGQTSYPAGQTPPQAPAGYQWAQVTNKAGQTLGAGAGSSTGRGEYNRCPMGTSDLWQCGECGYGGDGGGAGEYGNGSECVVDVGGNAGGDGKIEGEVKGMTNNLIFIVTGR